MTTIVNHSHIAAALGPDEAAAAVAEGMADAVANAGEDGLSPEEAAQQAAALTVSLNNALVKLGEAEVDSDVFTVPGGIVLDGPNPHVEKKSHKYGPNGYMSIELGAGRIVERVHGADGRVMHEGTI